jgi:hypothetical protein
VSLNGIRQIATIMKSNTFHGSEKYTHGRFPLENIFKAISIVKIAIMSRSINNRASWYCFARPGYVSNPIAIAERRMTEKIK